LNKTLAVCIKLESDLIFMILDSFCRELWGVSNDVKITKITQQTMKITQYYKLSQASMLSLMSQVRFWKLSLTWLNSHFNKHKWLRVSDRQNQHKECLKYIKV